jgi:autotransporter-associated beta strand protein
MRIGLPLTNGNFTKTGSGTLELAGSTGAFAGNVLVNGGTLRITGSHAGGAYAAIGPGRLEIGATGSVVAGAFVSEGPVTVNGTLTINGGGTIGRILGAGSTTVGNGVGLTIAPGTPAAQDTLASRVASEVGELSLGGSAYVDLTNNDLVIRGGDLADGVADSTAAFAAVVSGRGTTSATTAIKEHNGPGLRSVTAKDYNATQFVDMLGLTAVLNGDLNLAFDSSSATKTTFGGLNVDEDDTLVRFGMIADLNFDGAITAQDYFAIDQAFLGRVLTRTDGSVVTGPLAGDLTGDGLVNASDYFLIDQAFLRQGGTPVDAIVEFQRAAFGDEFVGMAFSAPAGAVPEPATLSLLALGATAMTGRRRRRM